MKNKNEVRAYLAAIGKRGGFGQPRELTQRAAKNGRDPRGQTRSDESRKAMASSRPGVNC